MEQIQEFISSHPVLALLQFAMFVWMLIDALRRDDCDRFWVWVIFFVPGIGAWLYFFVIFAPAIRFGHLPSWFQHRPSLDELRY